MKDEKHVTNKIETSENFDVVNMGISEDPEDQKMILNILTNTLYTDKITAVLREYGCNAADANVEAGKPTAPIKVHIPTEGEPFFSVRDVGGGMTEEQVLKVFCRLGRSTKRNSNDYTGMLGIGSKAGFAYGNSFLVSSFNKGIRTVYNCFRDSVGLPTMAKMDSSPTTEEDGIEIKLSVHLKDIQSFQKKAQETYAYFKVPPTGVSRVEIPIICQGKTWKIPRNHGTYRAIMGNIGYNLPREYINEFLRKSRYDMGLDLYFEIGELEIAANREGLQYKDKTQNAIRKRITEVMQDLPREITKMIDNASSLWQARLLCKNVINLAPPNLMYKGQVLGLNFVLPSTGLDFIVRQCSIRPYFKSLRQQSPVEINNDSICFIKDKCPYPVKRIREFLLKEDEKGAKNVVVFRFNSEEAKLKFWKEHQLDGVVLTPLSSLPLSSGNSSVTPRRNYNNKYTANCFVFDSSSHSNYRDSDYWTVSPANLRTGKGVYVPIYNFSVSGFRIQLPRLQEQIKLLKEQKLFTGDLYGIKERAIPALGSGWIPLKDHLQKQFSSLQQHNNYIQDLANQQALLEHRNIFEKDTDDFAPGSVAAIYMSVKKRMSNKNSELCQFIVKGYFSPWIETPTLPKVTVNLRSLATTVIDTYPMFKIGPFELKSIPINVIVEYVNLVERNKKK